jgi:hypothetical protein
MIAVKMAVRMNMLLPVRALTGGLDITKKIRPVLTERLRMQISQVDPTHLRQLMII